jgi:hypothetical protein
MAIAPGLVVLAASPDWVVGRCREVVVIVWRAPLTVERTQRVTAYMKAAAAEESRLGVVVVIEPGVPGPPPEVRAALLGAMRELGPKLVALAYLVTAEGFVGAAVRAVISGLGLMSRDRYPTRVFQGAPEVAAWMAPKLDAGQASAQITAAIEQCRAA